MVGLYRVVINCLFLRMGTTIHTGYNEDSVSGEWTSRYGVSAIPFKPCPWARDNRIIGIRQLGPSIDFINLSGQVYSSSTLGRSVRFRSDLGQMLSPSAKYFSSKEFQGRLFLFGLSSKSNNYVVDEWVSRDSLTRVYYEDIGIVDMAMHDSLVYMIRWSKNVYEFVKFNNWRNPEIIPALIGNDFEPRVVHVLGDAIYLGLVNRNPSMREHAVVLQKYSHEGHFIWEKGIEGVLWGKPSSIQLISDFQNRQIALVVGEPAGFSSDPVLHMINEDGLTDWTLPLSAFGDGERYYQIKESLDKTLILAGESGRTDYPAHWASLIEVFPPATVVKENLHHEIIISPNPFHDDLIIRMDGTISQLTLRDIQGKVVREVSGNHLSDCASLPPGMYLLTVETTNEKVVTKVVKGR